MLRIEFHGFERKENHECRADSKLYVNENTVKKSILENLICCLKLLTIGAKSLGNLLQQFWRWNIFPAKTSFTRLFNLFMAKKSFCR